jgi:hypothetical protein
LHSLVGVFRALRSGDLVVLAVLFVGAHTAALDICGGRDPMGMFALIMGWTWPALRGMIQWRTQGDSQRDLSGMPIQGWSNAMALAALGGAFWWAVLPLAIQFHSAVLLAPLEFSKTLRWFGVLLTLAGLLRPIWGTGRRASDDVANGMTLDFGLFFASASPLIGVLAAAGLAVRLWSARRQEILQLSVRPGGSVQDQKKVHRTQDFLAASTRASQRDDLDKSRTDRRLLVLALRSSIRGSAIAQS